MLRILSICIVASASMICADRCWAQTSTQKLIADPKAAYASIKKALHDVDRERFQRPPFLRDGRFSIASCDGIEIYVMETKDQHEDRRLLDAIGTLASSVLGWTHNLTALGYPPAVWEPVLGRYETNELAIALLAQQKGGNALAEYGEGVNHRKRAVEDELVARLAAYRQTHRSLTPVVWEGEGCGADEIAVKIETDPPGGHVLFIPTFFYQLCRAQGLDPEDTTRCNRWREAEAGKLSIVSGNYRYLASWNGGVVQRGQLNISWAEGGETKTVRRR